MKSLKVLAIVPARGGSKRIAHKNLIRIGGRSLVSKTLQVASESEIFKKIILTSDDSKILAEANAFPNVVQDKRPAELSTDKASTMDVIAHVIASQDEEFDCICLLQPTSPFRSVRNIKEAFEQFINQKSDSLVSVKNVDTNPFHIVIKNGSALETLIPSDLFNKRTQEQPDMYCLNGAIYFARTAYFKKNKTFLGNNAEIYKMSADESIDIDTEEDLQVALKLFEEKYSAEY